MNGTIAHQNENLDTTQPHTIPLQQQNLNASSLVTPLPRPESTTSCLSLSINQSKKRLSVSPIISTYSFYNKLNVNSPLIANSNTTVTTTTTTTTTSSTVTTTTTNPSGVQSSATTNIISAHQHFFQRNFSPMATLSRSPSCSSSPAINAIRRSSVYQSATTHRANFFQSTTNNLNVNHTSNNLMTPLLEASYQPSHYRTPLNNVNQQNTPLNIKRSFTPFLNNTSINLMNQSEFMHSEPIYEQSQPDYCFELIWTEPVMVAGDSSMNEKSIKFFQIQDLYNQKYVCYLMPAKCQLRCLKIEYHQENDTISTTNQLSYIPAKDAVFINERNLMVILDTQGSLFVYSGLTKLCKLQLHNIIWSNLFNGVKNSQVFQSPIITPIKSKLFSKPCFFHQSNNNNLSSNADVLQTSIDESSSHVFKTPKNCSSVTAKMLSSSVSKTLNQQHQQQQQHDYKALLDSTGSHFSVKLSDNRLLRVNLAEPSNCKLVNMCLEGFKFTLNKELYYEIVQQWLIHRFNLGQSLKNQLSLFLYLILNLCGCFDMNIIEQEIPFLSLNKPTRVQTASNEEMNECDEQSKRAKCHMDEACDDDWQFMLNDPLFQKFIQSEQNLNEFNDIKLNDNVDMNNKDKRMSTLSKIVQNESQKTPGGTQMQRQKRSISSTLSGTYPTTTSTNSSGSGGILYSYIKNILYTLHLIYEELKLYRSLFNFCEDLVQVLYLLASEIGLDLYMSYYEIDYPNLLRFKYKKCANVPSTPSTGVGSKSSVGYLIQQEPPSLIKFLSNLLTQKSVNQPFPVIESVTKRIMRTIKIFTIINLCNNEKDNVDYEDFIEQCFFKINFSGFQPNNQTEPHPYPGYNLRFKFVRGNANLYENIFSKCLEMGLCSLNEIYDYPLFVLFPILESIKWSRDNACFTWPSFAFDLIGRNDLAILKSNSDMLNKQFETNSDSDSEELQFYNQAKFNSSTLIKSFARQKQSEQNLCLNVNHNIKKDEEDGNYNSTFLQNCSYNSTFLQNCRINFNHFKFCFPIISFFV